MKLMDVFLILKAAAFSMRLHILSKAKMLIYHFDQCAVERIAQGERRESSSIRLRAP
jgi:hypothetical protein